MSRVRVVLADDHAAVREGLRLVLEASGQIAVVGQAVDGAGAIRLARELNPDVVLMDVRMPDVDGLAATAEITAVAPGSRVLILTTFDIDEYVLEALAAGAAGFLLKTASGADLVSGTLRVAEGDSVLDPAVTRVVVQAMQRRPIAAGPDLSELTDRERDVLAALGSGLSNSQIARHLGIGESTVKTHVSRVLMKLDAPSRVQAAVVAVQAGLA